ncbi:LysR substrate-binding domain-containing protein [Undibacterium arcticum]
MLMPTLTKGFTDRFPNVRVTPTEGNHAFLLDSLRTGLLDCVVTYDFSLLPELNFHSIIELPPFVLLPPEHRLAKNASVTLVELADEPMVQLDLPLSREYFNSLFVRAGLQPSVAYRSAFADVVHAMVAAGFGYTLWNFPLHNMMTASGNRFISRPLEPGLLPARLGLVSLESDRPRKVVRTFHDHCIATLTDGIPDLVAAIGLLTN